MKYPFLDLGKTTEIHATEIHAAVARVIDSGRYVGGEECAAFERRLAQFVGTRFCVGTANGLDALRLIFRAYIELGQLRPGDEVIVPANTYIASVLAVTDCGLRPVFAEPDARTLNLDWNGVERLLTERTKAVMTVHLYGRMAYDAETARMLGERGILLVEDNAQAIGAVSADGRRTGALGDAAAFSFYPTKNIGALGDAGAVTTDDRALAEMVRALANYGSDRRYHNIVRGLNSRLDPIQAAVLSVKLAHIEEENARRRELAAIYLDTIRHPDITLPAAGGDDMVWHQFVVQTPRRALFTAYLQNEGVGYDIHYATPPHRQPCYAEFADLDLPVTTHIADTVVSLPIGAATSADDARRIADIVNRF